MLSLVEKVLLGIGYGSEVSRTFCCYSGTVLGKRKWDTRAMLKQAKILQIRFISISN